MNILFGDYDKSKPIIFWKEKEKQTLHKLNLWSPPIHLLLHQQCKYSFSVAIKWIFPLKSDNMLNSDIGGPSRLLCLSDAERKNGTRLKMVVQQKKKEERKEWFLISFVNIQYMLLLLQTYNASFFLLLFMRDICIFSFYLVIK